MEPDVYTLEKSKAQRILKRVVYEIMEEYGFSKEFLGETITSHVSFVLRESLLRPGLALEYTGDSLEIRRLEKGEETPIFKGRLDDNPEGYRVVLVLEYGPEGRDIAEMVGKYIEQL